MKTRKKKFYSKSTYRLSDKKAQIFGRELERIKAKQELTPNNIIESAKNRKSPLHSWFDWNNTVASRKWRRQQAMDLVGLVGEVVVIEGKRTKQRSFFGIKRGPKEVKYVTIKEIKSNQSYRDRLLTDIIRHLENTTDLMKIFKKY